MSTTLHKRALRILLVVFALFLVAEVAWRIYLFGFADPEHRAKWARIEDVPAGALKYRSHPYLAYCLEPGYRRAANHHNALGFRGSELPREKTAGTYRIACLGGSSTYDSEIDDPDLAFPSQLERVLREEHGRDDVRVINAGVPGYSSWESAQNLELRVLDLQPDLVVVYHAINDVRARLVPPDVHRRDNSGYRRAWHDRPAPWDRSLLLRYFGVQWGFSQRNSLSDRTRVRQPGDLDEAACLAVNGPEYFRGNLENMVVLARLRGAETLLTSWAWSDQVDGGSAEGLRGAIAQHNEVSRAVASELGVPFYDFAAEMPADAELWADAMHNTASGARRKAELFAGFLVERVFESRASNE